MCYDVLRCYSDEQFAVAPMCATVCVHPSVNSLYVMTPARALSRARRGPSPPELASEDDNGLGHRLSRVGCHLESRDVLDGSPHVGAMVFDLLIEMCVIPIEEPRLATSHKLESRVAVAEELEARGVQRKEAVALREPDFRVAQVIGCVCDGLLALERRELRDERVACHGP